MSEDRSTPDGIAALRVRVEREYEQWSSGASRQGVLLVDVKWLLQLYDAQGVALSTLTQEIADTVERFSWLLFGREDASQSEMLTEIIEIQRQVTSLTAERDAKDQAIAQLRALTTWQPIETAPKDTDVLTAWVDGEVLIAELYCGDWYSCNDPEPHSGKPTHWQPLPPLPHAGPREETPTPARKEPTNG